MRPDMQHLLVERGHAARGYSPKRPKGWRARCRFLNAEDGDEGAVLPPRYRPQFSENLNPLRRYLAAQVGRPWDKVYAEIRRFVDADDAVQLHILQHLYDDLAVRVHREADGSLWHQHRLFGRDRIDDRWGPDLYVCPDTGLIRRVKRRRARKTRPSPPDHLPATGPDHEYRELSGQWYEVWWGAIVQGGGAVRAITRKRQLGYKELRTLGLRD